MSAIDPYVRILLLRTRDSLALHPGALRRGEHSVVMAEQLKALLSDYNALEIVDYRSVSEKFLDELIASGVIEAEDYEFAGTYLRYSKGRFAGFRAEALQNSPINAQAERVGNRFFSDVFLGYTATVLSEQEEWADIELLEAPASDRIVTFNHNEIADLGEKTSEIIEALEEKNQIEGEYSLREVILGQLKAGREFIRAGCCRAYLVEIVLLRALKVLIAKYDGELIGGLAGALATALVKAVGIDA